MNKVITFIRSSLIALWILIWTLAYAVFLPLVPFSKYRIIQDFFHIILVFWGRVILLPYKIKVIGKENLKLIKGQPVIVIGNHQSTFDIFLLNGYLPLQFRWLAKAELFKIPGLGWVMRAAGYIPVVRQDHEKAIKAIDEAAKQIRNGRSVVIFPEGTWGHPDGRMLPFKKGAFHLAKNTKAPILPITIVGSNRAWPNNGKFNIYITEIKLIISKPIFPEEYEHLSIDEMIKMVRGIIEENLYKYDTYLASSSLKMATSEKEG